MLNFDWLYGLPLLWGRLIILLMYFTILIVVWLIKSDYIYLGCPDRKWWRNLKLWATLAIGTQLFVYAYF
ncbi:hypothetical protein JW964_04180 [candidate division KSB1 bacterium]|nr:hypothetical protein [candidate division KSB1 bacterium]